MFVEIHTFATEGRSHGKTQSARVWDLGQALKLHVPYKGKIGSPPWALTISGSNTDLVGTGERGGKVVEFKSNLLIEFTPADVRALVEFAIQNGLLQMVPNPDPSRGREEPN